MVEFLKAGIDAEVYLVACTAFLNNQHDDFSMCAGSDKTAGEFLENEGVGDWDSDADSDAGKLIEFAAKMCYMSFEGGRKNHQKFINNIIQSGHGSVLEHASWTFVFSGVSRTFTHELVRHRAGFAYSQLSQRYVDESEARFIIPEAIANLAGIQIDYFKNNIVESVQAYREMIIALEHKLKNEIEDKTLRRKTARGAARAVLPNCTETKITVTANARAWRHFVSMRGSIHADAEIRHVALKVLKILQADAPSLFNDYELKDVNGIECAESPWPKI